MAAESARIGKVRLVAGCAVLLRGGEVDPELIRVLGGPHAEALLGQAAQQDAQQDEGLPVPPVHRYWLRVWAARGLLWCWDDAASEALLAALHDDAWRVREMCLKVVARHGLDEAIETAAELQDDPVPRVRAAAYRALVRLEGA